MYGSTLKQPQSLKKVSGLAIPQCRPNVGLFESVICMVLLLVVSSNVLEARILYDICIEKFSTLSTLSLITDYINTDCQRPC